MQNAFTLQEQLYRQQLRDEKWYTRRRQIIERDKGQCACCGQKSELQVHHRQYHVFAKTGAWKAPWQYADHLLVTLCQPCHKVGHQQFKVPVFHVETNEFMPANRMHAW
jgi:5-methylcytosine-specific restriction endonuclease McrA